MYRIIVAANTSKITNVVEYDTTFGPFVIETMEMKRRGKDSLGRTQKKFETYTSTTGYFKDHRDWISFFLQRDGRDKYVSSSEGRRSYEFVEAMNAKSYDDALDACESEVVKCFQDYFKDDSIY